MRALRAWFLRIGGLFGKERRDRELADEMESHLQMHIEDNVRAGMTPEEARRQALIKLGGIDQTKENYRDRRGIPWLESLLQDIRFGLRMLRKNPGFAIAAMLTLALGIGANTAVFSVVNGVLLNPLPYAQPNRLVAVYAKIKEFDDATISYPNFLDWVRDQRSFSALGAFRQDDYNLIGMGEPQRVSVEMVSASFFPMLGIEPVAGRLFRPEEDQIGAQPVVLVSGGFWKREFGASPSAVGQTLNLNGVGYTVVGVIPANFRYQNRNFQANADVFVPIGQWSDSTFLDRRATRGTVAVGRLKSGVTLEQAQADMDSVAQHLSEEFPDADRDSGIALVSLRQDVVGHIRPFLLVLLAAVAFVLLIACVNVANLLLARSTTRRREFAVRAALGASPRRVVSQLLTESLLLSCVGGFFGLLLAAWGTHAALRILPEALPRTQSVHLDSRVLFFTFAVVVLAGLIFGVVPAIKSSRGHLHERLNEGGRGSSGTRHRLQGLFVAVEMAMVLVLLVAAGLMIRSLANLWDVNPGFNPRNLVTFGFSYSSTLGSTPNAIRASMRQLDSAVQNAPGVLAASLDAGGTPMMKNSMLPFWLDNEPKPATQSQMKEGLLYAVQPDYLKAMGIRLIRGRFINTQDNERSPFVIDIDEEFARLYFPGQDPIGRRVNLSIFNKTGEIIGIVGHVKQWGLDESANAPVRAQFYFPILQIPDQFSPLLASRGEFVVRTEGSPDIEMDAIRSALRSVNSQIVVYEVRTMNSIVSRSLAARRFSMILLGIFAALALALSCVGIYGVMSYVAGQRTHEIGVRVALGAQRRDILRMVLGHGGKMALVGIALGLAASLGLTRIMSSMLFGVSATDPMTFAAVAIVLFAVALLACWIPARRAMRVDPMVALRYE